MEKLQIEVLYKHHIDQYGATTARVLKHLLYSIAVNKINGVNQHEGYTWTYNPKGGLKARVSKYIPDVSYKQARRAIDKLERQEVLKKGNFNLTKYYRASWYSVDEDLFKKELTEMMSEMNQKTLKRTYINHSPKGANREVQRGKSISPKGQLDKSKGANVYKNNNKENNKNNNKVSVERSQNLQQIGEIITNNMEFPTPANPSHTISTKIEKNNKKGGPGGGNLTTLEGQFKVIFEFYFNRYHKTGFTKWGRGRIKALKSIVEFFNEKYPKDSDGKFKLYNFCVLFIRLPNGYKQQAFKFVPEFILNDLDVLYANVVKKDENVINKINLPAFVVELFNT